MAQDDSHPLPNHLLSAEALRMAILRDQMARMEQREAARKAAEKAQAEFSFDFLHRHVGPEELKHIRALVESAVRRGELEALIYSFPSALCLDDGRAINNAGPDWPATLQGKAREIFEAFERHAKPEGYHLKARIINFPGGIPGDVGIFLSWAPPLA